LRRLQEPSQGSEQVGKMTSRLGVWAAALPVALALIWAASAAADPVADFYAGKQITFIVGSDPGGGYDAQARLVAKHLQRFIPGNPVFVVQNMPGAGSVLMSNRIANTAPKDGTVIGLVQRGILMSQLTSMPGIQYDVGKFNWIGSIASETLVLMSRPDAPVKNVKDLLEKPMIVGGTGATSDNEFMARLLNATIGSKLKIVSGYAGTNDVFVALERGELEGGSLSWSNVKAKNLQDRYNIVLQAGLKPEPDMPNVPLAITYVTRDIDKKADELWFTQLTVARPIMAAAEFPPDRLAAFRKGFMEMAADPAFRADGIKAHLEVEPSSYEAVHRFVAQTQATTPEVAKRLTEILNPAAKPE
jgi:tripartite-type tricarboxylate transporter receptor subunit TctC